jgi:hypothetical protein
MRMKYHKYKCNFIIQNLIVGVACMQFPYSCIFFYPSVSVNLSHLREDLNICKLLIMFVWIHPHFDVLLHLYVFLSILFHMNMQTIESLLYYFIFLLKLKRGSALLWMFWLSMTRNDKIIGLRNYLFSISEHTYFCQLVIILFLLLQPLRLEIKVSVSLYSLSNRAFYFRPVQNSDYH